MTNDGQTVHQPGPPLPGGTDPEAPTRVEVPGARVRPDGAQPGADRVVGGRYRLVERLGHGGMGAVWRARDEVVGREVAVKEPVLPTGVPEDGLRTAYERMRREARAAARVSHPSVVTLHDVVVEDGRPWIVMELVDGPTLAAELTDGPLPQGQAARIGLAVAGALEAAHAKGVLHRDVKPANVLLGPWDRVVLTDFGIAQVEGETGLTEVGGFVGSPEYTAPERALGHSPGPESDLFSLGVLLYTAIEGHSPFARRTSPATMQAVLAEEPVPPARASGALGPLIVRLLAKEPGDRPDAAEVRRVLEETARPVPAAAERPGPLRRFQNRLGSSLAARIGTAGAVVVLAAAVALYFVDPFGGVPRDWDTYDEKDQVTAQMAVPGGFLRHEEENHVRFTSPDERYTVALSRDRDVQGDAVEAANRNLGWNYERQDNGEIVEVDGRVNSREYKERKAADLIVTYRPQDVPTKRMRERTFTYVNGNAVEWRLTVTMPDGDQASRERGEEMFTHAVEGLDIEEL